MSVTVVRYRVKPEHVEENAKLVRAVYEALAAERPEGFRYATFLLEDGVSFVHVAVTEEGAQAPLFQLPSFQRFLEDIAERCDEPPQTMRSREQIGGYGW
jgi:quinol monooxygenase YgiN